MKRAIWPLVRLPGALGKNGPGALYGLPTASPLTPDALLRLPVCGARCLSVVGDAAALVVVMAR